jgi:hypothetical protein
MISDFLYKVPKKRTAVTQNRCSNNNSNNNNNNNNKNNNNK